MGVATEGSIYTRKDSFKCPCCDLALVSQTLVEILKELQRQFDSPVIIKAGTRCVHYNNSLGGATTSMHLKGTAADISVNDITTTQIYAYLDKKYPDKYGLGIYDDFVHIDLREKKERWMDLADEREAYFV